MKISKPTQFHLFFYPLLFILYFVPTIGRYFYQDDFAGLIMDRISSMGDMIRVISTPVPGQIFFRPVGALIYSLDLSLWPANAQMYFLHSIIWQLVSIYLIFLLVRRLSDAATAIAAEIIFLLYFPLTSGAVSLIGNRPSVEAVAFYLASLIFYVDLRQKNGKIWQYAMSLILFFLAMFTKEVALTLIPLLMIYDILFIRTKPIPWLQYVPYGLIVLFRYVIGVGLGLSMPASRESGSYFVSFGWNIATNFTYYLFWLILPAALMIALVFAAIKFIRSSITLNKAFPFALSVFGLSFALVNMIVFVGINNYRQLGWMHLSAIGMVIFLCSPARYAVEVLFLAGRRARGAVVIGGLIIVLFFGILGAVFIPEKVIKRNMKFGYTRRFVEDMVKLGLPANRQVYVVDAGTKDFKLSDPLFSPMVQRVVISDAMVLYVGDKAPKNIKLIEDPVEAKQIHRGKNTTILFYKDGAIKTPY
jgi:hypothetical protein